jgi:hypothetical protein
MQSSFFKSMSQPLLLAGVMLAISVGARAQGLPGNGGNTGGPPDPTAVPLDGGATLLLASGVAYGLRRLHQRRARR